MRALVLDKNRKPLDPCHPARARKLLKKGRAAVFRIQPFTIILKDRTLEASTVHPHQLKIDPGSKTTGLAIINEATSHIVFGAEINHRGQSVHKSMQDRASKRRARRNRKTRYRKARFENRGLEKCIVCGKNARHGRKTCTQHAGVRPDGPTPRQLAPSLESRVANMETWVQRIIRFVPVSSISMELVRFDTQALQNPEIAGAEYQQGTLAGYEVRQYLLTKFGHKCAYCDGASGDPKLEIEHTVPVSRGGTNRISNLAIACHTCNQEKGNKTAAEFGHPDVAKEAKAQLKDTAAVNTTRWALFHRLKMLGLPLEVGTGGRTKFNRTRLGLPKEHWLDAACVGTSTPDDLFVERGTIFRATAKGHGTRKMQNSDKYGFPRGKPRASKRHVHGFQTGDYVVAMVPKGKYAGRHVGGLKVRARGSFVVERTDVSWKHITRVQMADGFAYGR